MKINPVKFCEIFMAVFYIIAIGSLVLFIPTMFTKLAVLGFFCLIVAGQLKEQTNYYKTMRRLMHL